MSGTTFYSPFRDKYGKYVDIHQLHVVSPIEAVQYDDNKILSKNLTLGELRKSSFVLDEEKNLFTELPTDRRVIEGFQALRDALKKPIYVNSSFRSVRWDLSKKRDGESQHTHAKALDLRGAGLVQLVLEALETKNELYKKLRKIGVNGFGVYVKDDFVHIDVRDAKSDGGYYYWEGTEDEEIKKKDTSTSGKKPIMLVLGVVVGLVLTAVGIYKKYKDWRK